MLDAHLINVEKPARYLGQEMGSTLKPDAEVRFVLAFPDVYEVGMSHLGLKILYAVLNEQQWIAAERVYAPWPDMEELMRREAIPLSTLESATPLASADIVGFTLQYELSATNILNMLELSGIPLLATERGVGDPLVIAGGPCVANPEPLADFFDAFVLGDGEEVVLEIAEVVRDCRRSDASRAEMLERLAAIDGVYVPSFFRVDYLPDGRIAAIVPLRHGYDRVRRRFLADLNQGRVPTNPVIPFMKTVHDRVSVEIARGCTRGCRFCQAGYIYRPVRERTQERIVDCVAESLRNSGYEEVSLLSLSAGDYSRIEPLLKELMTRYAEERVSVSLPSLRVGTLTPELVEEIRKVRKTGFTLAPEAGSERLRQFINKGICEEDLLNNAYSAYSAGWRLIKLYFMTGLPGETDEDLQAIVDLAKKVKSQGKLSGGGGEVNVAVSSFVPKSHTPFQWSRQISEEEIIARQRLLRQELKKRKLNFKWHDARLSTLEGVIARGDRRLGKVLLSARQLGCRFDGWGEHFDASLWQQAFSDCGIDPAWYHRQRDPGEILPWDHLDFGVTKDFLKGEFERAKDGIYTEDCRNGRCSGCGVCDFDRVRVRVADAHSREETSLLAVPGHRGADNGANKVRLRFCKTDRMRFLSHLEMINLFSRAVSRASIPIRFSQGFHPHPRFSFATALSVGVESYAEYMDMEVAGDCSADQVMERLNAVLPSGVKVVSAEEIPLKGASLSVMIESVRYRISSELLAGVDLPTRIEAFLAMDAFPWRREKRGKVVELDLRRELCEATATGGGIELLVGRGKPLEFVSAISGIPLELLAGSRIEKLDVVFASHAGSTS